MKWTTGAKTDPGRRPNNEDYHTVVDVTRLNLNADAVLIVADGMGGRNFGEEASQAAVETIAEILRDHLSKPAADIPTAIDSAFAEANTQIYELSKRDDESEGMGTTAVVAVVANGHIHVGNAGDSRAYVIKGEKLEQITKDHSFVAEQLRAGLITEEGALRSKYRNVITRAIGIDTRINPEVATFPSDGVQAVLLCTDGLTNVVPHHEVERMMLTAQSAQEAAAALVKTAKIGGGRDNITAVVGRFGEGPIIDSGDESLVQESVSVSTGNSGSGRTLSVTFGLLALLFAALSLHFVSMLRQAGYTMVPAWPIAVKAIAPPPTLIDLAKVTYGTPVIFFSQPVQPEQLAIETQSQSLIATLTDGDVARIGTDGSVRATYPWSRLSRQAPGTIPVVPPPSNWHIATDPQGNVYMADAAGHAIYKYKSTGEFIGQITAGLDDPEAIAVNNNGDVYVVDGGEVKLLKAQPAQ